MPFLLSSIFFLVLFFSNVLAQEGQCQAFDSNSISHTYSFCSSFVSPEVYVAYNSSQSWMDTQLYENNIYLALQNVTSIVSQKCYKQMASFLCQNTFPSCITSLSSSSSSPLFPCQSSCFAAVEACDSAWSIVGLPALNCSSPTSIFGNKWEDKCTQTVFPFPAYSNFVSPSISSCPSVYGFRKNPKDNEAFCSLKCPDPEYTKEEIQKVADANIAVGVISTILSIFLICSYLIDYKKRKFPTRIQLWLCVSVLGIHIALLMSGSNPATNTMCGDQVSYATQQNNITCGAQAFFMIFFSFAATLWALALSFIIFICVVKEYRPYTLTNYEKYVHLVVWGVSGIFVIVAAGTHSMDYGTNTRIYCFLNIDLARDLSIDFPLYYIPMTVIIIAILLFFSLSLFKLICYQLKHREGAGSNITVRAQRRLFIVLVIMIIIFGGAFGFRYATTRAVNQRYIDNRTEWVNCKVRAELLGLPYPPECDAETNPTRRNMGQVMFQNVALATLGFWIFLGFGTDPKIFKQWISLGKCLWRRDFDRFWGNILHGYSFQSEPTPPSTNIISVTSKDFNRSSSISLSGSDTPREVFTI